MSESRYVPIDVTAMHALLADEMGMSTIPTKPGQELVYARRIGKRPVELRVFTSVVPEAGVSRGCGEDAIRIVLHSTLTDKCIGVKFTRVHRTKNALPNLKERAREAWTFAKDNVCHKCNGVTIERTHKASGNKFRGCCNFPVCR